MDDFLGLDEFEGGYDWVGAPWDLRGYPAEPWAGNGGFSIRREQPFAPLWFAEFTPRSLPGRDTMLNITRSVAWNGQTEDVWFGDRIHETTGRFPTQRVAMEFSFVRHASASAKDPRLCSADGPLVLFYFAQESPAAEANNLPWVYRSYGVHVGTGWAICRAFHDWEHIKQLLEWCPDAKLVLPNDCIPQ